MPPFNMDEILNVFSYIIGPFMPYLAALLGVVLVIAVIHRLLEAFG